MITRRVKHPEEVIFYQHADGSLEGVVVIYQGDAETKAPGSFGMRPQVDHVLDFEGKILASTLTFGDRSRMAAVDAQDPQVQAGPASVNLLPDWARRRIRDLEIQIQKAEKIMADFGIMTNAEREG